MAEPGSQGSHSGRGWKQAPRDNAGRGHWDGDEDGPREDVASSQRHGWVRTAGEGTA